ncbi:AAA family ATPase [Humidisolicoccus flavus]|uniref:AAA family ATPase n=1 Tax=Humidisolicoccus flavus TaxID=3111414 RepID=UPI003246D935
MQREVDEQVDRIQARAEHVDAPVVVLTCGAAGAGKTTLAKALETQGFRRFSYDEEFWARGYRNEFPPSAEIRQIEARMQAAIVELLGRGHNLVLDFSFSTRAVRDEYRALIEEAGGSVVLAYFDVPIDTLRERIALRSREYHANAFRLSDATLQRYVEGFERPSAEEFPLVFGVGSPQS